MKAKIAAINFKGSNVGFVDEPPYDFPIPRVQLSNSETTFVACFKVGLLQRLRLLFSGKIWVAQPTYQAPPQPIEMSLRKSDFVKE